MWGVGAAAASAPPRGRRPPPLPPTADPPVEAHSAAHPTMCVWELLGSNKVSAFGSYGNPTRVHTHRIGFAAGTEGLGLGPSEKGSWRQTPNDKQTACNLHCCMLGWRDGGNCFQPAASWAGAASEQARAAFPRPEAAIMRGSQPWRAPAGQAFAARCASGMAHARGCHKLSWF